MAKIDTNQIKGYAEMSLEDKLKALEAFEYNDNASELEKQKAAVSKANSEAAEWKRKHNALLSEDEQKKQKQEEDIAAMQKELDELRRDKTVSQFTAKFIAQGYDEKLAAETAKAMADGNTDKVFANQQTFLEAYAKQVKASARHAQARCGRRGEWCRLFQESCRSAERRQFCGGGVLYPPDESGQQHTVKENELKWQILLLPASEC